MIAKNRTRHPERVAGLIYLDAAFPYAYYDRSRGDFIIDWDELKTKVDRILWGAGVDHPTQEQLVQELQQSNLPTFGKDLQRMQQNLASAPQPLKFPVPTAADEQSFTTRLAWGKKVYGYATPEAELHQGKPNPKIDDLVMAGEQKYTNLRFPILAIFAIPHDQGPYVNANNSPAALAAAEANDRAIGEALATSFEAGVPSAHVVRLAHASHEIFMSNEADVLREMRAFPLGLR